MSAVRFVRLAIGAGALVLAGTCGAAAQEGVAMKSILGAVGIIPKERPPIEYRERAPLVLPPKAVLRPPASPAEVEARGNWPKDPDVAAARREAYEARAPETLTSHYRNSEAKRLGIDEVMAGRRVSGRADPFDPALNDRRSDVSRMTPAQLRAFSTDEAKLQGDGLERRSLSDPPEPLLKAAGGKKLKATRDIKVEGDPDSPMAFQRQQSGRY